MRRAAELVAVLAIAATFSAAAACGDTAGDRPVYLTFDTGHMGVAPLVAEVLARQHVLATFFLADEKTRDGGSSLDDVWAPWWKARAAEGHAFGSHTWDHVYWLADEAGGFRMRPSAGPVAGKTRRWSAAEYCAELARPAARLKAMAGATMQPIFRAPGGKTSPALLAAARRCGWRHVGWSPAGFLGDELSSERFPNRLLLERALRDIRPGDVLLAHLGIWSRKDPWAPADLEPLIVGLKEKGFCFATLGENRPDRAPDRDASHPASAPPR
ncbi:MAG: polysaccharide deacetylase family protein [Caldimonas sp.]